MTTRWYLGLMIGLIAIALLALASAIRVHLRAERALLLAQFTAAGITYDTASSTAELRLLWYAKANEIPALFSIDGTDPDGLRESLNLLRVKEVSLLDYFSPTDAATLGHTLYPWSFLQSLPDTEADRVRIIEHPSYASAIRYEIALRQMIRAYAYNAHALGIAALESTSSDAMYAFFAQTTDRKTMNASLDSLAAQAASQNEKALHRFRCLWYFDASCEGLPALLHDRAARISIESPVSAPSASTLHTRSLLHSIHQESFPPYAANRVEPPLIAMHSNCFPYPTTYIALWWQAIGENGVARKSSIANDIYLDVILPMQNPIYAGLHSEGVSYKYQISGHYYLCVDAGIDLSREASAVRLYEALRTDTFFTGSDPLAPLENKIRATSYIDVHDESRFIQSAAERFATEGYTPLTATLGSQKVEELDTLINDWLSGASGFDEVIREAANDNDYVVRFEQHVPLPITVLTRSFASVLFQAGNASISRTPVSFAAENTAYPLSKFRMTSLSALLAAGSTTAEVMDEISREITAQEKYIGK